jgi:hypothetical protein
VAVVVVGDVVDSRSFPDQRGLLDGLARVIERLDALDAAVTVGDEFQARYADLPSAIGSLARLRLELLDDPFVDRPVEVRLGIGVGTVDAPPGAGVGAAGQSGPGWWAARQALDAITSPRRAWPVVRWWVEGEQAPTAIQALLVALDTLLAGFDEADVSLARGLLHGDTASRLADRIGLSRQSVSARLHDHGVYGWVRAIETLGSD